MDFGFVFYVFVLRIDWDFWVTSLYLGWMQCRWGIGDRVLGEREVGWGGGGGARGFRKECHFVIWMSISPS